MSQRYSLSKSDLMIRLRRSIEFEERELVKLEATIANFAVIGTPVIHLRDHLARRRELILEQEEYIKQMEAEG
jgi:hypothetical protein